MECNKCKSEFNTATNLASPEEIVERKNMVDIAKASSPKIADLLGISIPVYKCPECGLLHIDIADVFIAMQTTYTD